MNRQRQVMDWQIVIIGVIFAAAITWLAFKLFRKAKADSCEKGCGCSEPTNIKITTTTDGH